MSSGWVKFSVPISSAGPQRPQFLNFSAASRRSWRVSLRALVWAGIRVTNGDNRKVRRLAYQAAAVAVALIVVGYLVHNASVNLAERRIASGFGFLERAAGFEISESPFLRYSASDTYLSALAVGVGNTLRVAFIGIVAATLLGAAVGLFRLSKNFLLRTLAAAYVEFIRNSPLLVQLFFWYAVITEALPMPREALQPLPGVFLTNRGLYFRAHAGLPRAPPGAPRLYRGVHRRDRARRAPFGEPRAMGRRLRDRPHARPGAAPRGRAAGAARHGAADGEPVPQHHEEQLARGGDRLSGPGLDREHRHEPDRAGDRGRGDHHGGVSHHQPFDLRLDELVQRADCAAMKWLRENLFPDPVTGLVTFVLVAFLWKIVPPFVDWAFIDAVWRPDARACHDAGGACWGFIAEKHRFILFGTYPFEQHWRPAASTLLLISLWGFSLVRIFWRWWLALVWVAGLTVIGVLMWGGVLGLPYVENGRWGGLILTLLLATFGIAFAFPLSIVLALGRRSELPVIRALCVGYIELIRGVPLISVLFMASVMLPLFLPSGVTMDKKSTEMS